MLAGTSCLSPPLLSSIDGSCGCCVSVSTRLVVEIWSSRGSSGAAGVACDDFIAACRRIAVADRTRQIPSRPTRRFLQTPVYLYLSVDCEKGRRCRRRVLKIKLKKEPVFCRVALEEYKNSRTPETPETLNPRGQGPLPEWRNLVLFSQCARFWQRIIATWTQLKQRGRPTESRTLQALVVRAPSVANFLPVVQRVARLEACCGLKPLAVRLGLSGDLASSGIRGGSQEGLASAPRRC